VTGPLRIVVQGYVVRGPLGGLAWHHLQYAVGLARLGHDTWFIEDSDDYPACYDPEQDVTGTDPTYGLGFAAHAFSSVGLADRWAYYDAHGRGWLGPAAATALNVCRTADLVLNLSGVNPLRPWVEDVPVRVLVDTDPGFTQARNLRDADARVRAAAHTAFFTFAENVGSSAALPDDGFQWRGTRQPVVLDLWPETPPPAAGAFTTVMVWESYPAIEVDGLRLGLKSDSFAPYLDLPGQVDEALEIGLGGPTAPRELLAERGWRVVDPRVPTLTLESYQSYIRASRGEFSVAKHGYVATHSGWFSERSANYLATGRPVVAEDTGYSDLWPVGEGLLAFSTPDEAIVCLADAADRYDRHRRAARELAEELFDSSRVLGGLLEEAFATTPRVGPS
jgi:hypothetical protein